MSIPKAGAKVRASDWSTVFPTDADGWLPYTPTWAATGTAVALGNGTIAGAYMKIGRRVDFRILLVMGSTTTFGTGAYTFTLPVTAANFSSNMHGTCRMIDASASNAQYTKALILNSATTVACLGEASNSFVGQLVPVTFAQSDTIALAGTFESAA